MAIDVKGFANKVRVNLWGDDGFVRFYYNFKLDGRKYRGIIDLSDRVGWSKRDRVSYAEAELVRIKLDRRDGVVDDRVSLDVYVARHYDRIADSSWKRVRVSHYERYISPIIGAKPVVSVLQGHVRQCIMHQEKLGLAPRTVKQTIEVLGPVFRDAVADRLIVYNPMDGVSVKIPPTKKMVNDASEKLVEIYHAIVEEFAAEPYYLALYLLAMQGRRKSEILHLRWEDVSLEHAYYLIRDTKNGEEQKIYLPPKIAALLVEIRRDSVWVFFSRSGGRRTNIEHPTARLKKRLGWNFTLHYLRNVIVSAMAERGLESIHLSGALGHKSAKTIDKYLTLNYQRGSRAASDVMDGLVGE